MEFYKMLATHYNTIFPLAGGKEEFFTRFLQAHKPKSALDLGCATGELTDFLNRQGCKTIGVDLSQDLLKLTSGMKGDFHHGDMVEFLKQPPNPVDLVICIGNTLPHLGIEQLKSFTSNVQNWINPGGHLIIQTVNYHKIINKRPPGLSTIERPKQGVKFTRLYDYMDDGGIDFTAILESPEGRGKSSVKLWPITPDEFKDLLPQDIKPRAEYGSFNGQPFDPEESSAWILVAEKIK